jgi:hypothetical protein
MEKKKQTIMGVFSFFFPGGFPIKIPPITKELSPRAKAFNDSLVSSLEKKHNDSS